MTTSVSLAESCGITYRQMDHSIRQGYVLEAVPAPGSGHERTINGHEAAVCARMAGLIRAGFRVDAAARIARETVSSGQRVADLGGGVRLTFTAGAEVARMAR